MWINERGHKMEPIEGVIFYKNVSKKKGNILSERKSCIKIYKNSGWLIEM